VIPICKRLIWAGRTHRHPILALRNLCLANLSRTDLPAANLQQASLQNANFQETELQGADLLAAELDDSLFEGTFCFRRETTTSTRCPLYQPKERG
jgi:uncharacterized protein YjbI with pentapeptide repeats